jgi:hypothetical protein
LSVPTGKAQEFEQLTDGGSVDFGDPIGEAGTIHTLHSELRTFAESFGCREASFRLSLPEALLARLVELANAKPEERQRAEAEALPPSSKTISAHVVEALGDGRRVRVSAFTQASEAWRLGGRGCQFRIEMNDAVGT